MNPRKRNGPAAAPVAATDSSAVPDNAQTATPTSGPEVVTLDGGASANVGDNAPAAETRIDAGELVATHAAHYEGFDPTVHAVDQDGKPIPKKGGGWQKKRGGNMRASASSTAAAPKPAKVDTLNAAKQTLNVFVSLAVMIFGDHWAPQDEGEKTGLTMAVKNYFDAKGVVEISPGLALTLAVVAYSTPRLQDERTRGKLDRIKVAAYRGFLWVSGFFKRA